MIFFNSSMPRSCSTLLQNILLQNPDIWATTTDPVLEYLYGARINYTNASETKAVDSRIALKNWRGFCWGGLSGYCQAYSDRPHTCIKTRGGIIHFEWFESFMPYKPKMICMVRNIKSIFASMEKIFRKNQESHQTIQNHAEMKGTSTAKRVDIHLNSQPVGLALERLHECILKGTSSNIHFIRAEDLCQNPKQELWKLYNYLELREFSHNFSNIEQIMKEDDNVYGIGDIHTIKPQIRPLEDDSEKILGKDICRWLDVNCSWYQKHFNY